MLVLFCSVCASIPNRSQILSHCHDIETTYMQLEIKSGNGQGGGYQFTMKWNISGILFRIFYVTSKLKKILFKSKPHHPCPVN